MVQIAGTVAEHGLHLAQRQYDPWLLLRASRSLSTTLFYRGEFARTRQNDSAVRQRTHSR